MSNNNKKDVEMKDDTTAAAVAKKEEEKKEEPYDPFFGKWLSREILSINVCRVQEGYGATWEGWKGQR